MSALRHFVSPWIWRMAWRDSRSSRGRLLLFAGCIVMGIAALAAIGSLDVNLRRDMWALVHSLQAQGVTIILTTHYIDEAE